MSQHPVSGNQRDRDHGRSHAGELTFTLRLADNRVMRSHHRGFHHVRHGLHAALLVILFDMGERTDSDRGSGIAAGVAAHAVAHGDQTLTGE